MNTRISSVVLILLVLGCGGAALAAEGSVKILSPGEGEWLDAMAETRISFEVQTGTGDHVLIYANGCEVAMLLDLKGEYALPALAAGPGELCIKVMNDEHAPTGLEQCVKVMVD